MSILAVPYAFWGAAVAARRRIGWTWAVVVTIAVAGTGVFLVHKAWWDSDDIPSLQDAIANGQGFEGTDEYDPAGDDHYNLPQNAPRVQILPPEDPQEPAPKPDIKFSRWTAAEKILNVSSSKPVKLAIRLLDYPAWHVEVNGQSVAPQHAESTVQIVLPLSPGVNKIAINFATTPDRRFGSLLSLACSIVLAGARFTKPVTHAKS